MSPVQTHPTSLTSTSLLSSSRRLDLRSGEYLGLKNQKK